METTTIPEADVSLEEPAAHEAGNTDLTHKQRAFILGNTVASSRDEIRAKHVIPTFMKDNEPFISHSVFIDLMQEAAHEVFGGESIQRPEVRLSHPVPGRVPEARDKPAKELLEREKTLFYERMAFVIEIPSIRDVVNGNGLSLTIGGVKAYNLDNMNTKSSADQTFKIFIGFKNTVCLNLCVWSDGFVESLRVKDARGLKDGILKLLYQYDMAQQLSFYHSLGQHSLSEHQFALLLGRCRMYQFLPYQQRQEIPALQLNDTQLNTVAKDYFRDKIFCRSEDGSISLWRAYNLFTGATKSSYIDTFLDRTVNAATFAAELKGAVENRQQCWFLS